LDLRSIWCSERRSRDFREFPLTCLFEILQPPSCFIFDCAAAGIVIPTLAPAAAQLAALEDSDQVDWSDWLCLCAASEDEELPDDLRLSRDFLTAVLHTPIKTAIVCHILQYFRMGHAASAAFPPCKHLWGDASNRKHLEVVLTALTDAIAADTLPDSLYHHLFRGNTLTALLMRHFLFAQYLLRHYRVHPVSQPDLPDTSLHPMWRQWSILLDSCISTGPVFRAVASSELFARAAKSFENLVKSHQFDLLRPYYIALLFHNIASDTFIKLLSEFARDPLAPKSMLVNVTFFQPLFSRLMTTDPRSGTFGSLCFLAHLLLFNNSNFVNDLRKILTLQPSRKSF
jgi:regulator-associated protein of mTOR